jgi:hypothetical protein
MALACWIRKEISKGLPSKIYLRTSKGIKYFVEVLLPSFKISRSPGGVD